MRVAHPIVLDDATRKELQRQTRGRSVPVRVALRPHRRPVGDARARADRLEARGVRLDPVGVVTARAPA